MTLGQRNYYLNAKNSKIKMAMEMNGVTPEFGSPNISLHRSKKLLGIWKEKCGEESKVERKNWVTLSQLRFSDLIFNVCESFPSYSRKDTTRDPSKESERKEEGPKKWRGAFKNDL